MPETAVAPHYDTKSGRRAIQELRAAFAFFRQHADRRYSSRTLLKLMDTADLMENNPQIPVGVHVVTASVPFHYDEETEVKSGGVLGVGVMLPDRRMLIAVREAARRRGIGTQMYSALENMSYPATGVLWLSQHNVAGQHFALSLGVLPQEMRSNGAIAYARGPLMDEVADVDRLVDEVRLRPRTSRAPLFAMTEVAEECDPEEF